MWDVGWGDVGVGWGDVGCHGHVVLPAVLQRVVRQRTLHCFLLSLFLLLFIHTLSCLSLSFFHLLGVSPGDE
jgi:hypothetical protein